MQTPGIAKEVLDHYERVRAEAVAAERERCAKIADMMPRGASFSDEFEAGHDDACKRIAAAIRQSTT